MRSEEEAGEEEGKGAKEGEKEEGKGQREKEGEEMGESNVGEEEK